MLSASENSSSESPDETSQFAQRPSNQTPLDTYGLGSGSDQLSDTSAADTTANNEKIHPKAHNTAVITKDKLQAPSDDDSPDSPPPSSRPNRYRGPPSTWHSWTAPERKLAASLDYLTARDLSVHLYNVFKLKQRQGRKAQRDECRKPQGEGEASDGGDWVPSKVWTAWPLPPDEVPREEEERGWEEAVALPYPYIAKPRMPGDALREILAAQVARKARYILEEREWADSGDDGENPTNLKPVVMADDERGSQVLRPTIQHLLTELDGLLLGLHHARRACLNVDKSGNEVRSQARGSPASLGSTSRGKTSASGNGKNSTITSGALSEHELESHVACRNKSSSRSRIKRARSFSRTYADQKLQRRKLHLGARDWSDVLGVASMTGWNPAVIERAAARCASLFEEGITFRTLKAGEENYVETQHQPGGTKSIATTINNRAEMTIVSSGIINTKKSTFAGVHLDGFLQPVEGKKSWKYSNNRKRRLRYLQNPLVTKAK